MKFVLLMLTVLVLGCASRPIAQSSPGLMPEIPVQVPVVDKRTVAGQFNEAELSQLNAFNEKAGKPTFGLIQAFYQLPVSMPAGAVHIEQGRIFGQSYQSFWLENSGSQPYAVEPTSAVQAQVLSQSMSQMLDAGVRFVEVSMADAVKIMKAEQRIVKKQEAFLPGRLLPSGVNLLVSIQQGMGATGSVFVARVIRSSDGRLLALSTMPNAGPYTLQPLIQQVVLDSLKRLSKD